MKLSNKILIGILVIVILFQFFATVKFRSLIKHAMSQNNDIHHTVWNDMMDSEVLEKEFDQSEFSNLKIRIRGNVVIKQSNDYKIIVKAPEKLINSEYLDVSKAGKTLTIKCPTYKKSNNEIDVVIFMPKLTKIKASEDLKIKLEGFDEKYLDMTLTGDCSLTGYNNRIKNLDIDGFGEISVNFKDCEINDVKVRSLGEGEYKLPVNNIKINAIGDSDFDLDMENGKITGTLIGEGNIKYSGELKRENVSFLGPGKVRKK